MGKVIYTPLAIDSVAKAADLNAIFTAIAAQSALIDGSTNAREEGIDFSVLHKEVASRHLFKVAFAPATTTVAAGGAFANLMLGANTYITTTGPYTLAANEYMRIRAWVWFHSTVGQIGIPVGTQAQIRLTYNAGTAIAASVRIRKASRRTHGTMTTLSRLVGPQAIADVSLQVREGTGAGPLQIRAALLIGRAFRRVT